jgi:hypothetical protein
MVNLVAVRSGEAHSLEALGEAQLVMVFPVRVLGVGDFQMHFLR